MGADFIRTGVNSWAVGEAVGRGVGDAEGIPVKVGRAEVGRTVGSKAR